jgi:hypothetical protein
MTESSINTLKGSNPAEKLAITEFLSLREVEECAGIEQNGTKNLGVRSPNLFGRAINSLVLILNFRAIFWVLTVPDQGQRPVAIRNQPRRPRGNICVNVRDADLSPGRF